MSLHPVADMGQKAVGQKSALCVETMNAEVWAPNEEV